MNPQGRKKYISLGSETNYPIGYVKIADLGPLQVSFTILDGSLDFQHLNKKQVSLLLVKSNYKMDMTEGDGSYYTLPG